MAAYNANGYSAAATGQDPLGNGIRRQFLFVDDNIYIVNAIQRVAGGCGLDVRVATSLGAFRERYLELIPDLIGFDLAMPGGDGIELIRFLASEGCRAPVLIITGHDRRVLDAAARLGRERGLNIAETLSKPFSVETLKGALERMADALIAGSRSGA